MVSSDASQMKEILGIAGDWIPPRPEQEQRPTGDQKSEEMSDKNKDEESDVKENKKDKKEKKDRKDKKDKKDKKEKKDRKDKKDKKDKKKEKEKKGKKEKKDEKYKNGKRKDKEESNDKSKLKQEAKVTPAESPEPTPLAQFKSNQFVFQYLSNKLIRKKAEIARRKRVAIEGVWSRTQAVGM